MCRYGPPGETFEASRKFIVRTRPFISFLENVPTIQQGGAEDEDGCPLPPDTEYIKSAFEEAQFTVVMFDFNARVYGSCAERSSWWCVVFDVHPSKKVGNLES